MNAVLIFDLQALRTSDGSNTSVRSVAASPKAISHKQRRATTDNGSLKVN
jgi:hypothetical protein